MWLSEDKNHKSKNFSAVEDTVWSAKRLKQTLAWSNRANASPPEDVGLVVHFEWKGKSGSGNVMTHKWTIFHEQMWSREGAEVLIHMCPKDHMHHIGLTALSPKRLYFCLSFFGQWPVAPAGRSICFQTCRWRKAVITGHFFYNLVVKIAFQNTVK